MINEIDMDWLRRITNGNIDKQHERFWNHVTHKYEILPGRRKPLIQQRKCKCGKKITVEGRWRCSRCLKLANLLDYELTEWKDGKKVRITDKLWGQLAERKAIPDRQFYPSYEVAQ